MASYGFTFSAGDTVTPTRLNSARTVSDIVNADIKSDAAIALSKLATGALPSAITVASANLTYDNGPTGGFRNRIINGNFDIWQRGTSFAANAYGADRWFNGRTGSTCTMSRQSFSLGQTDVPNEPTYFCRMTVTSSAGTGNGVTLEQRIEDARTLAGQQVTVSFWAKADASRPIAVEFSQNFGTGGSPSTRVLSIGTTKTTLSTAWQKVTVTATMPSISGKTLGSDGNHNVVLYIWLDAGSDFNSRTDTLGQQSGTFDIAQVQVERGSVATPFEARPIGTELALCQRYYCETRAVARGYNGGGYFIETPIYWPQQMRTVPTTSVTTGTRQNVQSVEVGNPSEVHARFSVYGVLSPAGDMYSLNDIIKASAEL